MRVWWRSGLFKIAVAISLLLCLSWFALDYFIPSPPSKITIATGPRGTTLDYYGQRYRDRFEEAGIQLVLRPTAGGVENFKLIHDPHSGVDISQVPGGISNSSQAPELLSLGVSFNVPIWIFYSASLSFNELPQLEGKRIAVGREGSGVRHEAERILERAGINSRTAIFLPLAGNAAINALKDGNADAAFILSSPDAPAIKAALEDSHIRLMDFSTAEAFTRIFPDFVRLTLPKGVIGLTPLSPPNDVTLVGITSRVLVRNDLDPAIVQLMAQILKEEQSKPGLFQRAGEFPKDIDSEYPMSQIALDYYKNGPSFLQAYLPFWMAIYARRVIAFSVAALAIALPVFSFAPRLYGWIVQERLRKLYRRLRVVEKVLQAQLTKKQMEALQIEIVDIDRAADSISMRNSDLYFILGHHLDRARSHLAEVIVARN